jgi:hypothetical protein
MPGESKNPIRSHFEVMKRLASTFTKAILTAPLQTCDASTTVPPDFCDRLRHTSRTVKTLQRRIVGGLPARFQTATASCPEQRDQPPHLLPHLRCESVLKPAKPAINSLHRRLCLFGDCGAGKATSIDIERVTTFFGETNWSINTTGLLVVLVGMRLLSNRSNRRERLLLIVIVGCHRAAR